MNASSKKTLKALLWKDVRQSKWILILGTLIWSTMYLVCLILLPFAGSEKSLSSTIKGCATLSLLLSFMLTTMLIASVTTEEYKTRAASFLAALPPSNAAILLSKFILSLVTCGLWVGGALLLTKIGTGQPEFSVFGKVGVPDAWTMSALVTFVFGVTWLVGLWSQNPGTTGMCGSAIAFSLIFFLMTSSINSYQMLQCFANFAMVAGLICFALGWWFGLRRGRARA